MSIVKTDTKNYTAIANAINEKTGNNKTYTPGEMAQAIKDIQTGGGGSNFNRMEVTPETSSYSVSIQANTLYNISTPLNELNISFETSAEPYTEYSFIFKTSSTGCSLVVPASVVWSGDIPPTLLPNKLYEVSIVDDLALISKGATI